MEYVGDEIKNEEERERERERDLERKSGVFFFFTENQDSIRNAEAADSHDFGVMSHRTQVPFSLLTLAHLTFALLTSLFALLTFALLSFKLLSGYLSCRH